MDDPRRAAGVTPRRQSLVAYRPEIDGLRAVAVIAVILFHAGIGGFDGGFVGVDVFFVISGYLITSLIVAEMDSDRFSIAQFYERRARRLLPALFLVMAASLPFAWSWLLPTDLRDFAESLVAVATFTSNILFWSESGYFDAHAELKPLLHTWSLAVEEQYYILFPPFVLLFHRFGRRFLAGLIGFLALASLAFAQWQTTQSPDAAFFLLPARGWEILLGACVGLYLRQREVTGLPQPAHQVLSMLGLALILGSIVGYDRKTPFPGAWALVPTLGTALVILFARSGTLVHRCLVTPAAVGIGLISYSAYLWHQPVFAFARLRAWDEPSAAVMLVLVAVSLGVAYLSWRFVETPMRDRRRTPRSAVVAFSGVAATAFVTLGLWGHVAHGFPQRDIGVVARQYQLDNRALGNESWEPLRALARNPEYKVENNAFDRTAWFRETDPRVRLLVVGNSHSKDVYNVLSASESARERYQLARYGIQIAQLARADAFFDSPNYQAAQVVLIATRYTQDDLKRLAEAVDRLQRDRKVVVLTRNIFEFQDFGWRSLADRVLHDFLYAGLAADGVTIAQAVNRRYYDDYRAGRSGSERGRRANAVVDEVATRSGLPALDRMDYICSAAEEACYAMGSEHQKHFYDYAHHTLAGARFFGKRVDAIRWLDPVRLGTTAPMAVR